MVRDIFKYILLFAAAVASLSCTKNGGNASADEFIGITPSDITVEASLTSKPFSVEANCNWKVELKDENGAEVKWIESDKSIGKGNSKVTLKIYANEFKNPRKALLTIVSDAGTSASAVITQKGDAGSQVEDSQIGVRVGSFNLRMSTLDSGDNGWENRKSRVMQSVKDNDFDFFGVQECDTRIQSDLESNVGSIYACKFFSPYSQTGNGDKAQGLLYKKTEFTLSDWHYFWPSANPETMSTNDTGSAGNFSRGGCCGVLTHNQTGIKMFVMVTHGCLNDESNNKWASVYADMERKYNSAGLPSFFVGDMNAKPGDPPSVEYRKHWKDVYTNLTAADISGPAGTFNGFKPTAGTSRIDFIYYRGSVTPSKYVCNDTKYGGFFPSDHLPIYADFTVNSIAE